MDKPTKDNASEKFQIEVTRSELDMILDGLSSDVNYVDDPMECSGIVEHPLAKEMDVLHDAIITSQGGEEVLERWLIADESYDDDDDSE